MIRSFARCKQAKRGHERKEFFHIADYSFLS